MLLLHLSLIHPHTQTIKFMEKINFSSIDSSLDLSRDVFVHPTNSSYGIWASIFNKEGYKRIYSIKKRDKRKPFFITVSSIDHILNIAQYDPRVQEYLSLYPGKTFTFILPRWNNLPKYINPDFENVGIQVATWDLLKISNSCGGYMFGTSANISGEWAIYSSSGVQAQFWSFDDIVFLDAWDLEISDPSTIIDLTQTPEKILRWSLK